MAVRSRVVDRAAGVLLLAGAFANFAGVIMFSIRGGPSEMAEELFPSWGSGAASLASSELSGACSWRPWCYRRWGSACSRSALPPGNLRIHAARRDRLPRQQHHRRCGRDTRTHINGRVPDVRRLRDPGLRQPGNHRLRPGDVGTHTPLDRVGDSDLKPRLAGHPRSRPALGHLLPDPSLDHARIHRCRADPAAPSQECTRSGPRRHPGRLS